MKNQFIKTLTKNIFTKLTIIFVILIFFMTCCKNNEPNDPTPTDLVGKFTWTEWQQKAGWKDYSASDYTPDPKALDSLKKIINLNENSFIIFTSNWCHADCEPEVPRMMKLLIQLGYKADSIAIYGLNKTKKEPVELVQKYNILWVPTLVVLKNNQEVGKIIEHPTKSWEEDLIELLQPTN